MILILEPILIPIPKLIAISRPILIPEPILTTESTPASTPKSPPESESIPKSESAPELIPNTESEQGSLDAEIPTSLNAQTGVRRLPYHSEALNSFSVCVQFAAFLLFRHRAFRAL